MTALSKNHSFASLMRFAAPSMIMMLITSLYQIVDSVFVSRFVNTTALSAINIVYPVINIVIAVAIMLASGASAIIAKELGEGKSEDARKHLTLIVIVGFAFGIAIAIIGAIFLNPILRALGANDALYNYCRDYLVIQLFFTPFSILQMILQTFFITAGRPSLGMGISICAGLINGVLDFIFMVPMNMGIAGASLGTGIGYTIPAIVGLLFFFNKENTLHFVKPKIDFKMLLKTCSNGSSEMVSNLATGLTTLLFNLMMLKYAGEDGVAAITIVLYAQFLLTAIVIGFSMGAAPVISYNYGAKNVKSLKSTFKYCLIFICVVSVLTFIVAKITAPFIVLVFTPVGTNVYNLATQGFGLFSYSFLFVGFNVLASGLFTALSNGRVSAIISFLRTFLFTAAAILIMPYIFELQGVWLAVCVAEAFALVVSVGYVVKYKKKYHYF